MGYASKDARERAVAAYKTGQCTQQQVAAMFGVHYKTVANWLAADAAGRGQAIQPRGHRRSILDADDLSRIDQIVKSESSITLEGLMARIGKTCSLNVYGRALKKLGFTFKKNSSRGRAGSGRYKKDARRMD